MVDVLPMMSDILGKVRVGLEVGGKKRNMGAFPEGELGAPWGPVSTCSQEYVSVWLSVAEPVKVKGVLMGIVLPPAPAFTTGTSLPVAVLLLQVPDPVVT